MILAIDIGNTNIVIGCIKTKEDNSHDIVFSERIATDSARTSLEYVVELSVLFELYGISKESIKGSIISSVVPPLNDVLRVAILKFLGVAPVIVGPGVKTGLNILMDNPAMVGADLIVNAVAGLKDYGSPLIMIDMGTATTVSVIDKNMNYIGGMIMPGAFISLKSLVNTTSQLPNIAFDLPKKLIGKNTVDSMKSGMLYGQAGSIDGIIDRITDELGYEAQIVATGGLSGFIVPACRHEIVIDNNLTMKGLLYIYEKNSN